jgi:hydrogenase maturation factor HypF (carbamoyltransferase family)
MKSIILSSKESLANRTGIRAVALEGSVINNERLYMNIPKEYDNSSKFD